MKNLKRYGSHMMKLILTFIVATLLLLWGWNTTIAYLFELPTIQFKQATGLMVLIGTISIFLRSRWWCNKKENTWSTRVAPVVEDQS